VLLPQSIYNEIKEIEMSDVIEEVEEQVDIDIDEPSLYGVVFHNDNTTPIDFVVSLIIGIFGKSVEESEKITMDVHNNGSAVVAVYDYDIAEQKKVECDIASQKFGFQLKITIEEQ